jgi:hypothetical protein
VKPQALRLARCPGARQGLWLTFAMSPPRQLVE